MTTRRRFFFGGALLFFICVPTVWSLESALAWFGGDGHLEYGTYANENETNADNLLPDFSRCGYKAGGIPIPDVPVILTLYPQEGDDTPFIQNAIDSVSARTPDANGFRGAILLKAGRYQVVSTLYILTGGVVLRGEGQDVLGTVLEAVTPSDYDVIRIGGGSASYGAQSGTTRSITSSYVPTGATSFNVSDTSGYAVGDWISVRRTPNQFWIDDLAMGQWGWTPSGYTTDHERYITGISGNTITVDVPLVDVYQDKYGGGQIFKLNPISRINKSAVENLRLESCYVSDTDELHPWNAIKIQYAENSWVYGVTAQYFAYSCVNLSSYARYITVEDCAFIDPKSIITGGRRYSFNIESTATRNLFQRCYSHESRHDFVLGSRTRGPNVFVDCYADRSHADAGPHHRWSTGTLFDNIYSSNSIDVENRESSGSGHGWSGAQMVFWNCQTPSEVCDAPKGAMNFAIGSKATKSEGHWAPEEPFGWWEHQWLDVSPRSLYLQQLYDRLGQTAVNNITIPSQRSGNIWNDILVWGGKTRFQSSPIDSATPIDQLLNVGSDVIFEVVPLSGATILEYQWYEINAGNYTAVSQDSPLLVITNAQSDDLGRSFFCRIMTDKGPYWSKTAEIVSVLSGTNLALNQLTTASSIYGSSYTPEKAVDANLNSFWNSAAGDEYPWWQVDLGQISSVAKIVFVNRNTTTASLLNRLSDLQVDILDENLQVVFTSELINPGAIIAEPESLEYYLPTPVAGRYVKVTKMTGFGQSYSDTQTNIAEIEVYPMQASIVPAAPGNPAAIPGNGFITLDWADNAEPDVTGYVVYRSTTSGGGYQRIVEDLTESTYIDTNVAMQTYYYIIRAETAGGVLSGFSAEVSGMPKDQTPPSMPAGLTGASLDGAVRLDWQDNTENDLTGYNLYRSLRPNTDYVLLAANLVESTYTDTTVSNGKTYYFVVTTVDEDANESGRSEKVEIVPRVPVNLALHKPVQASSYYDTAAPEYAVDGQVLDYPYIWHSGRFDTDLEPWIKIDLEGTCAIERVMIYNRPNSGTYSRNRDFDLDILGDGGALVWSNYDETTGQGELINEDNQMSSPAMIEYILPVAVSGRYVVLTKRSGLTGDSATANISEIEIYQRHLAPGPVTGLLTSVGSNHVSLDWNDNTDADFAGYTVYRSRQSGAELIPIASGITESAFTDESVLANKTYYYLVTSTDTDGNESGLSNEVEVVPCAYAPMNMALNKAAEASSYYDTSVPGYAVDGQVLDYPAIWYSGRNGTDLQPWIRVPLGGRFIIEKIMIYNWPNPGTYSRNRDFDLDVFSDSDGLIWSNYDEATGQGERINEGNWMNSPAIIDYTLPETAAGHSVVLTKRSGLTGDSATANISEFEVHCRPLAPVPAVGLTVEAAEGGVSIDWTDNPESNLAGYHVYRSLRPDDEYVLIAAGIPVSTYLDTTAANHRVYYYRVTAVDDRGFESGYCEEVRRTVNLTADLDGSKTVDLLDFAMLSEQWLSSGYTIPSADIAPDGGDGWVDLYDLLILAEQWGLTE